jgi:hypothetical protein
MLMMVAELGVGRGDFFWGGVVRQVLKVFSCFKKPLISSLKSE